MRNAHVAPSVDAKLITTNADCCHRHQCSGRDAGCSDCRVSCEQDTECDCGVLATPCANRIVMSGQHLQAEELRQQPPRGQPRQSDSREQR